MFVHFINFALLYLVGVGQIVVDDSGQNCVVTVNGANDHLTINPVKQKEQMSKIKTMQTTTNKNERFYVLRYIPLTWPLYHLGPFEIFDVSRIICSTNN